MDIQLEAFVNIRYPIGRYPIGSTKNYKISNLKHPKLTDNQLEAYKICLFNCKHANFINI